MRSRLGAVALRLSHVPSFARATTPVLVLAVAALSVAGCKTLSQHAEPPAGTAVPGAAGATPVWDARKSELQGRQRYQLKGRVAVAAGGEGFNARMLWQQSGPQSFVALDGPLGVGGVQITSEGTTLNVVTSRGDHLNSDAARSELTARLGFDPPIASLHFWILGVPDPSQPFQENLDSQQRLSGLKQEGWDITYDGYTMVGSQFLPSRMTLQRAGVRVRLIVDGWS
jgi:outer membrane lipoprotein LolB